ncbi:MAG: flagellar protein FliT [Lachnospiraceae bacterium]|nr:flagellar protein FliT [Lachnospiraceae bacterium]
MSGSGYVKMLRESLEKKVAILSNIESANEDQARILSGQMSTPDEFQENLDIKGRLISEIDRIDSGFQEMFERVREVLSMDKESYKDDILEMQNLIREITDRSTHIQLQEQENKMLAEKKFAEVRAAARDIKKNEKVVTSYYQNMMQLNNVDPQFLDSKK